MTLGKRISQYRKQAGLSQEALGERLGVSRQAVSKWETGAAAPDMENLLALAREFGVSVAELTETPELSAQNTTASETIPSALAARQKDRRLIFILLTALVLICLWQFLPRTNQPDTPSASSTTEADIPRNPESNMEQTTPTLTPKTDFALIWYGTNGDEEFLELGAQENLFPFDTTLELTEALESHDTDFGIMTSYTADCGTVGIGYYHIEEDPESDPESPERESIWCLSTIVSGVRTPRGIHPGSTKAQVLEAYGDELVYCLKDGNGYTLAPYDYFYAFQTPETGGAAMQLFMKDGIVSAIQMEHMAEWGNDAYAPNQTTRFPLINGEPDFSFRQEPEQEDLSDARKVYIAWNQLVTNNNLSAEEQYTYRREIFSLLPTIDWQEFGLCGGYNMSDDTIFALMTWLETQRTYSASEMLWLQLGSSNPGIDGVYADRYSGPLFHAFYSDPLTFVKALASGDTSNEDAMHRTVSSTVYYADLYPEDTQWALAVLETAMADHLLLENEVRWAEFLKLYLTTPIHDRSELPKFPSKPG